ncbi:MAG: hypothetical protein AAFZ63_02530 [Bacteroidota bacterium]
MNYSNLLLILASILIFQVGCGEDTSEETEGIKPQIENFEEEKAAILQVLNDETKAAFDRDYQSWKDKWVHEKYVTKTYMNFADSTMTETLGWNEIDEFVRTYIEEHPEPAPLPTLVDAIDVRLYGNGAWVSYEQNDSERGLKRETRLMEKENGQWKIAGMQTIIYGFKNEE